MNYFMYPVIELQQTYSNVNWHVDETEYQTVCQDSDCRVLIGHLEHITWVILTSPCDSLLYISNDINYQYSVYRLFINKLNTTTLFVRKMFGI
jgi:hypothetical protein